MCDTELYYSKLPITDQGDLGICYSHAAVSLYFGTVLATTELSNSKKNKSLAFPSPLGTALDRNLEWNKGWVKSTKKSSYTPNNPKYRFEGGTSCQVVEQLSKHGACRFDKLEGKLKGMSWGDFFYRMEELNTKISQELNQDLPWYLSDSKVPGDLLLGRRFQSSENEKEFQPGSAPACLMEHIRNSGLLSESAFGRIKPLIAIDLMLGHTNMVMTRVLEEACGKQNRIKLPKAQCHETEYSKFETRTDAEIQKIKNDLEKHFHSQPKKPAAISYCSQFLTDQKSPNKPKTDFYSSECGPHVSTLLDSRIENGEVQYLLQNSWGSTCAPYAENLKKHCENGRIWVPADLLAPKIHILSSVDFEQTK